MRNDDAVRSIGGAASSGAPRKRLSQAERTAAMKRRLIDASIHCLHAYGYAATSTELVIRHAGVSRGALLHQFPTRVDLMMGVVQAVYAEDVERYGARLGRIRDPVERYFSIPEAAWAMISRPAGMAVLEIMVASRSQPGLPQRLAPVQAEIDAHVAALFSEYREQAGLRPVKDAAHLHRTILAALRGLSIEVMFTGDHVDARTSVALLRAQLEDAYAGQLVERAAQEPRWRVL
jgi:AcrR family transcriptional regulator